MGYSKTQFEELYKGNYSHMYRLAFFILDDSEDAKDAVSQVFTQLWNSKPQIKEDCIRGYLMAATKNQSLHILRRHRLRMEMEDGFKYNQDVNKDDEAHEELMNQLQQVIEENLSEQDRRILKLHYEEEMTYSEAAEALGISPSAINKHITHSLYKIREKLKITK